jgi:hypothetical protein
VSIPKASDSNPKNVHDSSAGDGPQVELRIWVPAPVAEWLGQLAGRQYKNRSRYIRDHFIALWLRNGRPGDRQ